MLDLLVIYAFLTIAAVTGAQTLMENIIYLWKRSGKTCDRCSFLIEGRSPQCGVSFDPVPLPRNLTCFRFKEDDD